MSDNILEPSNEETQPMTKKCSGIVFDGLKIHTRHMPHDHLDEGKVVWIGPFGIKQKLWQPPI